MIKKYIAFTLVWLLLITTNSAFISAQTRSDKETASIAKIKDAVSKISTGKNKRIKVRKKDGTTLKGTIGQTNEDSFTITELDTNQSVKISYSDVAKVSGRDSKGSKVTLGIVIGAIAAVGTIVGLILLKRCENEGGC